MDEYLKLLLEQIRCTKARPYIKQELQDHMEDQIAENMKAGMDHEQAEKEAVRDMGDPVETGISLDSIHRPQAAWKLLGMIILISIAGVLIHAGISGKASENAVAGSDRYVFHVMIGLAVMMILYLLDYTVLAKFSKIIAAVLLSACLLVILEGGQVNGARIFISLPGGRRGMDVQKLMLFYVPIYGAILYKYRDGGFPALLKSIVWLIIPVFITFRMPNLIVAIIMIISMLIQLTVAILKGWFKISVKKTIVSLWAVFMFLPIMLLFVMYTFHLLAEYQEARIRSFFSASGEGFYLTSMLRTFSKDILFVGNSGNDVIGSLPEFNSDYIFSYILNSYGSIAGIVVVAVLAALVMFIFGASIKQKNELGMVMGFGCGMIILLNILLNLLGALGIIPPASSFLPFLSIGRSNILLCYALVGIIMSIYRYKDVYPKKIRASQVSFQKTINI